MKQHKVKNTEIEEGEMEFRYRCSCGEATNNKTGRCDTCNLAKQIEDDIIQ